MKSFALSVIVLVCFLVVASSSEKHRSHDDIVGTPSKNHTAVNKRKISSKNASPPFARFLATSYERKELLNAIKEARRKGVSRNQLHRQIDRFMRDHLNNTDYRKIQQLHHEGRASNQELLNLQK